MDGENGEIMEDELKSCRHFKLFVSNLASKWRWWL